MRVMAIDYGDRRTGFAFSDLTNTLVGDAFTVEEYDPQHLAERIAGECEKREVGTVVLGLPKNMDGTEGPRAALYREMAATIQAACGMEVVLWDERRTTVEAHQILSDCNYHGKKRKNTVDAVAASLILEGYLAFLSRC